MPCEIYIRLFPFFSFGPQSLLTLVNGQQNQYLNFWTNNLNLISSFSCWTWCRRHVRQTKKQKNRKESSSQQQTSSSRCRSLWGSITCVYCRCEIWLFFLTVGARFYTAKYIIRGRYSSTKIQSPSTKKKQEIFYNQMRY